MKKKQTIKQQVINLLENITGDYIGGYKSQLGNGKKNFIEAERLLKLLKKRNQ